MSLPFHESLRKVSVLQEALEKIIPGMQIWRNSCHSWKVREGPALHEGPCPSWRSRKCLYLLWKSGEGLCSSWSPGEGAYPSCRSGEIAVIHERPGKVPVLQEGVRMVTTLHKVSEGDPSLSQWSWPFLNVILELGPSFWKSIYNKSGYNFH